MERTEAYEELRKVLDDAYNELAIFNIRAGIEKFREGRALLLGPAPVTHPLAA